MGESEGSIIAAIIVSQTTPNQPRPPRSVPGPMSIPSIRTTVTAQHPPATATRRSTGQTVEALGDSKRTALARCSAHPASRRSSLSRQTSSPAPGSRGARRSGCALFVISTVVVPSGSENSSSISCGWSGWSSETQVNTSLCGGSTSVYSPAAPASVPSEGPHHDPDLPPTRRSTSASASPSPGSRGASAASPPRWSRRRRRLGRRVEDPLDPQHPRAMLGHSSVPRGTRRRRRTGAPSASAGSLSIRPPRRASRAAEPSRWVRPSTTRADDAGILEQLQVPGDRRLGDAEAPVTSPTVAAPPLSRSTMSRRSGCASAVKASLAIVLTIG